MEYTVAQHATNVVNALVSAVHNLNTYLVRLKSVAKTSNVEHLIQEHGMVVDRMDNLVSYFSQVEMDPTMEISLSVFELSWVNKALNEMIVEHEKSLVWFTQMGSDNAALVQDFQDKIRELHFTGFFVNSSRII
jgi:hypothetical protein